MSEISTNLHKFAEIVKKNNIIDPEYFTKYDVKRGLRNKDGTGVLVGLTQIGDVHGYVVDEKEKVPVEGRLSYRGIDVRNLVEGFQQEERLGFEETVYLLLLGKLPTKRELDSFTEFLGVNRKLPDGFTEDMILKAPSQNIMNKLARSVLAAYSYDENPEDFSVENLLRQCIKLIAWFPVFVAYAFQAKRHYYHKETLFIHSPDPALSTAENILKLIRPTGEYTKSEAEMLDLALILHAEHGGGNNSAFSIHVIASASTDAYSAISAAVGSLKGAKHGGASNKVREMMNNIKANVKDWKNQNEVSGYIKKLLNKEAFDRSGLVYGMGHAVYTMSDPRAVLLKEKARSLAEEKGFLDEFNLYQEVENLTPKAFYELKGENKIISANVDFYSGFVYHMLDIPEELYTPIFAVSRISGWSAHLIEEYINGGRIMRPAYKQIGSQGKMYIPLAERNTFKSRFRDATRSIFEPPI